MSADELTNDLGTRKLPTRGIFKTTHWATQDNARLQKNLQSELHVSLQGQRERHTHTLRQPTMHLQKVPSAKLCTCILGFSQLATPCTAHFQEGTTETGDSAHLANLISLILMCMSLQL